ncbi:MAG: hypothetical protein WC758_03540 [Candidatus Woesearchaeota archaeon]|jgi:hypothetical protein
MIKIIPRDQIKHLEWNNSVQTTSSNTIPPIAPTNNLFVQHSIGDLTIESLVNTGQMFYNANIPTALTEAQNYADSGVVATMPYLIAGKANSDKENYLWKNWLTAHTEEDIGVDSKGIYTTKGNSVLITLHGGGILTPDIITKAYEDGLTPQNAAKLNQENIDELLQKGILPSGEKITIYRLDDLKSGISDPFGRYAVITEFDRVKSLESKQFLKSEFLENPLVLARAGTVEYLEKYYDLAHDEDGVGCWHRFDEIDPTVPQGRLLYLVNSYVGLDGNNDLRHDGRFVGVAPEARGTKK